MFYKEKNKEKCDKKSISKEYIEDIVFAATQNFFMQVDLKALAKKITEIYNKSIEENYELKALEKELADINKKLKNLLSAIENGIFNDSTNQRMKELEISKKELEEKIAQTSAQSIQPFNEEQIYSYLLSFKDIDQSNEKAKQRLIDMFINKVVLFDEHVDIYFNTSDDKKIHLKLKEIPEDGELFDNKKQPETTKGSDCLHLAGIEHLNSNLVPKKMKLRLKMKRLVLELKNPKLQMEKLLTAKPRTRRKHVTFKSIPIA